MASVKGIRTEVIVLTNDVDLTLADVQSLAGRDAPAAFFAWLGYNPKVSEIAPLPIWLPASA